MNKFTLLFLIAGIAFPATNLISAHSVGARETIQVIPTSSDALLSAAKEQRISTRMKQLVKKSQNNCDSVGVPYCYKFKATVNINSGYLRVWKSDSKDNAYVAGELKKGEVIHVRDVFKYRGKEFALITHLTADCMSTGCLGRVELRYLK